jgi:hypothetical protein
MITKADALRTAIIRPALQAIFLWSPAAEDLLLGTAAQESGFRNIRQIGSGPALGYWQMEPATHNDIWGNYLRYHADLAYAAALLAKSPLPTPASMVEYPQYGAAMARVKYLRVPEPLPKEGDIEGLAAYWKHWYNTPEGAGTPAEFVANWKHFVEGE